MSPPPLTLGIPVYNGVAAGIDRLIRSMLADRFADFAMVVSDNGSTDGTWDLLNDLRADDSRITLHRFDENQGVVANFNRVLDLAESPFFKWCAVGDVTHPDMLSSGIEALREHETAVLAHFRYDFTDGRSFVSETADHRRFFDEKIITATRSSLTVRRVRGSIDHHGYGGHLYGVIRTAVVKAVGGHPDRSEGDRILLGRLTARGQYIWDERILWSCFVPPTKVSMADYRFRTDVDGSVERHVLVGGALTSLPLVQRAAIAGLLGGRILGRKFVRTPRQPPDGS